MACYIEVSYPTLKSESWGSSGDKVRFTTKSFEGPFEDWADAVRKIEEWNMDGATIWEFEER